VTSSPFLDSPADRRRRARRRRRRARRRGLLLLLALTLVFGLGVFATRVGDTDSPPGRIAEGGGELPVAPAPGGQEALGPLPSAVDLADRSDTVRLRFKRMPRAGLLVNLDTGEVLWRHRPERTLPIASLTKMMTALVVVDALRPRDKVRITKAVLAYRGSGMGVLRKGKRVKVETLLNGLMLPSGNDAARALAFRTAGSIEAMVGRMNRKATAMGLQCTSFTGVEGLSPRNRSCPADLAVIARKVLDTPRLARIVKRRRAILPFPVKGGRIFLYNSNPLLRTGYPGVIGVKTGYTNEAGRCLVVASRRNGVRLAAIVLRSPDPATQTRKLLDRGFAALR
jgi:D-alanyl-D-alanine carboxypeptidase